MGVGKNMKTVLDVTVCSHSRGGVGRWVRGLSKGLFLVNEDHLSVDLPETHPSYESTVLNATAIPAPPWMKFPLLRRILLSSGMLDSTRASRIKKRLGTPDIIHLSGVQPEGEGKRKVVTFFDDTPWISPESHTEQTIFYADRLRSLVDSGAAILAISSWAESVAQGLFGISSERTACAGGAADEIFTPGEPRQAVLGKYNLEPGKYFLHVGSYVPRKNIPFLIRCFKEADTCQKLVLAGVEQWGDEILENNSDILFLKDIPDKELLELYRGSTALLLPSSREGLGLPVMEAFACNTPVVASDVGALPETVGRSGLLLPVLAQEAWVRSIREVANGTIADSLRRKAESASVNTWMDVGKKAMDFYRSLL